MKYTNNKRKNPLSRIQTSGENKMKSIFASEITSQVIWQDFTAHFKSSTTSASYETDLAEIMNYFEKDFLQIDKTDIKEYYEEMQNKITKNIIKAATVAKKFRELHSFAEYICDNKGRYGVQPSYQDEYQPYLKLLEKQKKFAKSVPVTHIDMLLKAAEKELQSYTILVMLYRVGLTSTEIIRLKLEDLAIYEDGMYVAADGRKELCYIPEDAADVLKSFIKQRKDMPYLFYNKRGNQLNLMYISRLMKRLSKEAGVPEYSAESIRNTCGVILYAYGVQSKQVAGQLGVTEMQIHRYRNMAYRDSLQREANSLVKLRVLPPK